jgi:hypothetical protein
MAYAGETRVPGVGDRIRQAVAALDRDHRIGFAPDHQGRDRELVVAVKL